MKLLKLNDPKSIWHFRTGLGVNMKDPHFRTTAISTTIRRLRPNFWYLWPSSSSSSPFLSTQQTTYSSYSCMIRYFDFSFQRRYNNNNKNKNHYNYDDDIRSNNLSLLISKFSSKASSKTALINDKLIRALLSGYKDPNSFLVRLVVDRRSKNHQKNIKTNKDEDEDENVDDDDDEEEEEEKEIPAAAEEAVSTSEIVSLSSAIQTSLNLGVDLVGVNLQQEPPVIKAADYNKLLFNTTKQRRQKPQNTKATKELTFKTGIAENDFRRKIKDLIKYLSLGHKCQVTVRSNKYKLSLDSNALNDLLGKVQSSIRNDLAVSKPSGQNEEGTSVSVIYQPIQQKKK